jgi:hypothetical protein
VLGEVDEHWIGGVECDLKRSICKFCDILILVLGEKFGKSLKNWAKIVETIFKYS